MFLSSYDLLMKYLIAGRITYLEQMYTRHANDIDNITMN